MNRRRFLRMMSAAPAAAVAPVAIEVIRPAPYHVGRFAIHYRAGHPGQEVDVAEIVKVTMKERRLRHALLSAT